VFVSSLSTLDLDQTNTCWQLGCSAAACRPLTSPCLLTSPRPSEPVLLHCGRYVMCGVRWCKMPCWRWSAHLPSQSSTSVVRCWLVCLDRWCNGFSPCWTPPPDSCSLRGDQNTQLHFSVNFTGLKFGENSVPVVCSSVPEPARSGTVIPLTDTPPIHRSGCSSPTQSREYVNTRRAIHPPIHSWWPSVPCGSYTCLEFLATQCSFYVVAGFLLSASKDSPVRCVISALILNAILELICTVSLQQFLWQRHLNHIHSFKMRIKWRTSLWLTICSRNKILCDLTIWLRKRCLIWPHALINATDAIYCNLFWSTESVWYCYISNTIMVCLVPCISGSKITWLIEVSIGNVVGLSQKTIVTCINVGPCVMGADIVGWHCRSPKWRPTMRGRVLRP